MLGKTESEKSEIENAIKKKYEEMKGEMGRYDTLCLKANDKSGKI